MQEACFASIGSGLHVIGGFERTLRLGMRGLRSELEEGIRRNGETDFLCAGRIVLDAAMLYFQRVADEAKMAACLENEDAGRKARLIRRARACERIRLDPPQTFQEALQLVALLHELITTEQRCGSLSFGRFDKYMAPYYERDLAAGRITPEEAQEMIDAFWLGLADNRWGWQNITLGGYDSQDGFCCNDITRMCLSASRRLRRDQPQVTFRCHQSMPDDIWTDILDLMKLGLGFPSLYSDDACIAAQERVGIPHEDAEQYAVLGCVELTIPGKEYSHSEGMRINWPKLLEVALHGGVCPVTGRRFEVKEKRALDSFASFEDFYRWFQGEFLFYVDRLARAADEVHTAYGRHYPVPFLSVTMEGCARSGLDAAQGGTIYNHSCINTCGQANLIDSLAAIQKFVFEERRFTLPQLVEMMDADFIGYEAQQAAIRRDCPRFGSDAAASRLMKEMSRLYCDYLIHLPNKRGGVRKVGFYSVEAQVYFGKQTGALPDGRKKGDILANGTAPIQGTERFGPTSVLHAVSRIDTSGLGNGMALDLKFHPRFFDNREHRDKFRDTVMTYFSLGGMQVQVNVVSRETLLAAQKDPDKYADLVVRVSGFSAYFSDLSRGTQDEIIRRTEF